LTSADFNEQVRPGGILNLTVKLQNTGFASLINERPIYVAVSPSPDGRGVRGEGEIRAILSLDPRTWEPGTITLTAKLHIPSNIEEGEYQLALWLPDAFVSLQSNSLYAIQFANENVFDESTGYNVLGGITVDKDAGGSYQRGTKFEEIESTSSVERGVVSALPVATTSADALVTNPQISNDAENVYFSFDYISGTYNAFQIFVDEDQNSKTGYIINDIGAEALFENQTWNIYNGAGTDWNWSPTELLIQFEDTGSQAQWKISRSLFKTPGLAVVFQLVDANWDTAFVTPKITYTLK
jgi:hypothetical protein